MKSKINGSEPTSMFCDFEVLLPSTSIYVHEIQNGPRINNTKKFQWYWQTLLKERLKLVVTNQGTIFKFELFYF